MVKKVGILAGIGAALVAVLVLAGSAFAQDGGVSVSDGSADVDGSGDVTVDVTDVGGEGLGAWTVDIGYDNSVLTATDCEAEQGGVCNAEFTDSSVRVTGASAGGLDGDNVLGSITFECNEEGTSDLTISLSVFSDATIGDPQELSPSTSNGEFVCGGEPEPTATTVVTGGPSTGTGVGSDGNGLSWLVALFAVVGVAVLATGYGVARSRA